MIPACPIAKLWGAGLWSCLIIRPLSPMPIWLNTAQQWDLTSQGLTVADDDDAHTNIYDVSLEKSAVIGFISSFALGFSLFEGNLYSEVIFEFFVECIRSG